MTEQELRYLVTVQDRELRELKKNVRDTNKAVGTETPKAAGKASTAISGFASKALKPAIGILAGVGFGAFKAGQKAVDLGEQVNKAGVVFGKNGKQVVAWSKTLAASFGVSSRAGLEAAGTFGNMLVPMGFARGEAAKMSTSLVELGSDLASFNNVDPSEALDALRAGLAGETEPLRRLGVFLNQARIEQEAMDEGIWDGVGTIDAAAKAQATYAIILQDTKDAQGDFHRTSDSLANQQRILTAEWEDAQAELGAGLIPVGAKLASILTTVLGLVREHGTATKIVIGVVAGLAVGILLLNAALGIYNTAQAAALVFTNATNAALIAQRALMAVSILGAIILLAAGLVLLWKKSETFRKIVIGTWNAIKKVFEFVVNFIRDHWQLILAVMLGPLGLFIDAFVTHFDAIRDLAVAVFEKLRTVARFVFDRVRAFVLPVVDKVKDLIGFVKDLWGAIQSGIDKISGPLGKVADLFGKISGFIEGAAGGVGSFFGIGSDGVVGVGGGLGSIAGAGSSSISPTLWDDIALGQSFGLGVASGYRPGAVTSTGNPSLHGVYPAKAVDMSGSAAAMRAFFFTEVGRAAATGLREVIHSPLWWHPGVGITAIPASAGTVLADHYNHVHVGSYDRGGWLPPRSATLAINGTSMWERVGPPGGGNTYIVEIGTVYGDERKVADAVRTELRKLSRRSTRDYD